MKSGVFGVAKKGMNYGHFRKKIRTLFGAFRKTILTESAEV